MTFDSVASGLPHAANEWMALAVKEGFIRLIDGPRDWIFVLRIPLESSQSEILVRALKKWVVGIEKMGPYQKRSLCDRLQLPIEYTITAFSGMCSIYRCEFPQLLMV
jgi:hypothetical protein